MRYTILFLCPHNAAKSVLAAAYCQHLAAQCSLDVQVTWGKPVKSYTRMWRD
jgi:protein-tyrosine-phosphatase